MEGDEAVPCPRELRNSLHMGQIQICAHPCVYNVLSYTSALKYWRFSRYEKPVSVKRGHS